MYDVSKPFSLPLSLALPLRSFARSFFFVDRSLSLGLSFCGLPRFLIGQRNFLPSTHRRNSSIAPTPTWITKLFSPRPSFPSCAPGLLKPRAIPIWDRVTESRGRENFSNCHELDETKNLDRPSLNDPEELTELFLHSDSYTLVAFRITRRCRV